MLYTIGIDVGGCEVRYGLFDEEKTLKFQRLSQTDATLSSEEFFDEILKNIEVLLSEAEAVIADVTGVGIGISAFAKYDEGRIIQALNYPKLTRFDFIEYLSKRLGNARVVANHGAQTAALAEHRYGAGRGLTQMLYCALGSSMCAGIIIDGKLYCGGNGMALQSGHMVITPDDGLDCECGNKGCFMSWTSGDMIVKHVKNWIDNGETSIITEIAGRVGSIMPEHISVAYERGDSLAERALSQMAKYIGIWMYNMYLSFGIETYVIGGGLVNMGKKLVGPIRKSFDMYNHSKQSVVFKTAQIKANQGIMGANELLFE